MGGLDLLYYDFRLVCCPCFFFFFLIFSFTIIIVSYLFI